MPHTSINKQQPQKHIHVVGAAIIRNGELLCAQRGEGRTLAGYWEFPGGKIEEGETSHKALHREISEELLCTIKIESELCSSQCAYDFGVVHLTIFVCSLVSGTPQLTEHTQIAWVPLSKIKDLTWAPADADAVDLLAHLHNQI